MTKQPTDFNSYLRTGRYYHGRTFTFFPLVAENDFKQSATQDLLQRVFGGSIEGLVTHLLESESISIEELAELRKLINRQLKKKG